MKRVGTKRVVVDDVFGGRRRVVVFWTCFTESVDGGVLDWFRCQLTIGDGYRVTLDLALIELLDGRLVLLVFTAGELFFVFSF